MRTKIIAGNWKMNLQGDAVAELINAIKEEVAEISEVEVVVCPPFTELKSAAVACAGSNVRLGAQNVHWESAGAFTGEISTDMLKKAGVTYVIIGHSERRQYFGESDESARKRVTAALEAGLTPILCVGETLDERDNGSMEAVVTRQIKQGLEGLEDNLSKVVIAYEPVWAIGTGRTATPAQAQEAHALIRRTLAEMASGDVANTIRIQYGGSMKPENARELLGQPDIDGGLIGGASLNALSFAAIVKAGL